MDLTTTYMGFHLAHPLVPGAGPLTDDLEMVRRLEDAGASAIVMPSLFEEQIVAEQMALHRATDPHAHSFPEALSYFPTPEEYRVGPEEYLEQVGRIKRAVAIPVIASLNGVSAGGWLEYARLIEEAGADGLEMNLYSLATDPAVTAEEVERGALDVVRAVRSAVKLPLAVKLSPFYTSVVNFARRLDETGADALVFFNRFYQPDIDVEELEIERALHLSTSSELLLRLRFLAIVSGRVRPSLAVTGGVHTALDAIKALMAGAHAVQIVSALLLRGPDHLRLLRTEIERWLEEHEYESLGQMIGSMSLQRCPDPASYERANYAHILQGWRM